MGTIRNILQFYIEGFRSMTVGRTLWAIIILKLIVIFLVLKLFFFHDYISENAQKGQEADFVSSQILNRQHKNP